MGFPIQLISEAELLPLEDSVWKLLRLIIVPPNDLAERTDQPTTSQSTAMVSTATQTSEDKPSDPPLENPLSGLSQLFRPYGLGLSRVNQPAVMISTGTQTGENIPPELPLGNPIPNEPSYANPHTPAVMRDSEVTSKLDVRSYYGDARESSSRAKVIILANAFT
ncbi:hypothetical protein DTO166G4_1386 [Paecilomyces variotii]|nr:hypothetical protein DTO166G4_1386 [Paecilomyces variotii]KAJ9237526.1 hypothetical protein DTO169E5_5112 [Paecilomyces variotii]KAJ9242734.1 hypothetical protein DTO166G5_489 [Paecilomyces variotii]KAJ9258416.1 hypothetical protein DTO207G8_1591 [Paecilomyces variotii]KAJ9266467.1 hypothetical protein DTO195F2_990 [Paecilomyces variotii]